MASPNILTLGLTIDDIPATICDCSLHGAPLGPALNSLYSIDRATSFLQIRFWKLYFPPTENELTLLAANILSGGDGLCVPGHFLRVWANSPCKVKLFSV